MNTQKITSSAGLLTAVLASLCCIAPVLALVGGVSGIAANFSWIESYRPYFIGLTMVVLGVAWYQKLRPNQAEANCGCEASTKISLWRSKAFLGMITVFAGLMLTFPSYAHIFYPTSENRSEVIHTQAFKKVEFKVSGMTCSGCEKHVEGQVTRLPGIVRVHASYEKANTKVEYDPTKTTVNDIQKAIDATGYQAILHKAL